MNLLLIIDSLNIGGKEKQLFELVIGLPKNYNIYVITFNKNNYYKGINVHVKNIVVYEKNRKSVSYILYLIKYINKHKIDIVHTWDVVSAIFSGLASIFTKIPHINGSIRGSAAVPLLSKRYLLNHISYLVSNIVVANSKAGLKSIKKSNNQKYRYIYNGIKINNSPSGFSQQKINQYGLKDKFIVGMVANFRNGKDYDTFIKAAVALVHKYEDIVFIAIGDGESFERIVNSVEFHLRKRIIFLGKIEQPIDFIHSFDIGVMMSSKNSLHGEGISNSIMEYMSMGRAVIATESGGNNELVKDRYNGIIVPEKDCRELILAILRLRNNPKLLKEYGKNSYKKISREFSNEQMVANYNDLYLECVK
ncbi:MAG: glycosyltransferase family 4 protein [Melioribacteraceae bacterium]|nr:glycosyltransferase family 4 protein [Melioribacteraceae bacterium]MCF8297303.1 glycosyltransferase family 4 protein [Saprospiraceae bacterium]MCF8428427.1 glycosyltransferase family 4 protein [Bacteroidia bacterium]